MEAREYFEKEYGHKHIETVVEMQDWVSLYGMMDEFAEWKVKNCSIPDVVDSEAELCGKKGCNRPKMDGNVYCSYHYEVNFG